MIVLFCIMERFELYLHMYMQSQELRTNKTNNNWLLDNAQYYHHDMTDQITWRSSNLSLSMPHMHYNTQKHTIQVVI